MSKFLSAKKQNPCPVCQGVTDCRTLSDSPVVLCKRERSDVPGFHFVGEATNPLWGKFLPVEVADRDREQWIRDRESKRVNEPAPAIRDRESKRVNEPAPAIVPVEQLDKEYRRLQTKPLNDIHRADLTRRGLTDADIETIAPFSVRGGYAVAFRDVDGFLCGAQTRLDKHDDGGKYKWFTPWQSWDKHNQFNEMPLAVWQPEGTDTPGIAVLCEGLGVKPYLTAQRLGMATIGASGAHWQPKTFTYTLEKLQAKEVWIAPDAGMLGNRNILGNYKKAQDLAESLGIAVKFLWWGQVDKSHPDIDELTGNEPIEYLTPAQFWALSTVPAQSLEDEWIKSARRGYESRRVFTPKGFAELTPIEKYDRTEAQRSRLRKIILNQDFGDREVVNCSTPQEAADSFVDGLNVLLAPTGSGKTEALEIHCRKVDKSIISLTPTRALAYSQVDRLGLAMFRDNAGVDDRVVSPIHSSHKIKPLRAFDLIMDETEQNLDALYRSPLCRANRANKVESLENDRVRKADKKIAPSATIILSDIEKLETIAGSKAKIIRLAASPYPKAKIEILTGDGSPSSDSTAINIMRRRIIYSALKCESMIIHTDTAKEAEDLQIRLEKVGKPDEILVLSRKTEKDPRCMSFYSAPNKGLWLAENGITVLIYTPKVPSGVSIIDPGFTLFDRRFVLLSGNTAPPANSFQGSVRYRSSTPIEVCAPRVSNWNPTVKYGRNQAQDEAYLAAHLGEKGAIVDPWVRERDNLQRLEFANYAYAYSLWAERDGHEVTIVETGYLEDQKLESVAKERAIRLAEPIAGATPIPDDRAKVLRAKPELSNEESLQLAAWDVRRFLGLAWDAPLSTEEVISEGFGRETKRFSTLLTMGFEGFCEELDKADRAELGETAYLQDLPSRTLRRSLWEKLGVFDILEYCILHEYSQSDPYLLKMWDKLCKSDNINERYPRLLGFKITMPKEGEDPSKVMIKNIGMLLRKLGIKTKSRRSRGDNLIWVYSVCQDCISQTVKRLQRFMDERPELRSTPFINALLKGMDQLIPIPQKVGADGELIPPEERSERIPDTIAPLFDPIREPIAA